MSDLAWAAGLFEGEGTITISKSREYTRPHVSVTSTDIEVIEFFASRWPAEIKHREPGGNARRAFVWYVGNATGARQFVNDILPHLRTERVRAKAELLLEDLDERRQGSRDPKYRARSNERMARMRELNRRGR